MDSEKKTESFSVKVSSTDKADFTEVMELYAKEGEKQGDALRRIFEVARREQVRGTHPELEDSLKSIDGTISTLIKQINGIVAGQDAEVERLKDELAKAIEKRNYAVAQLSDVRDEANRRIADAEASANSATTALHDMRMAKASAEALAEEKTQSNTLLLRQVREMEACVDEHKKLKAEVADLKEKLLRAELEKEKAVMAKERELYQEIANLKAQLQLKA